MQSDCSDATAANLRYANYVIRDTVLYPCVIFIRHYGLTVLSVTLYRNSHTPVSAKTAILSLYIHVFASRIAQLTSQAPPIPLDGGLVGA